MPSDTPTSSNTPKPTATETRTAQQEALFRVQGVLALRAVDIRDFGDSWNVYLEIDVLPGYNTQKTADALRQVSYQLTGSASVEFSVILWDRQSNPVDWVWNNRRDEWTSTQLSSTPED